MEKSEILAFVNGIAEKKGATVDEDTDLFAEQILDSMEIIHLLSYLQDTVGKNLSLNDLNYKNFQSVRKIVEWLQTGKNI